MNKLESVPTDLPDPPCKIIGYRELTKEKIDLMNEVKSLGKDISAVVGTLESDRNALIPPTEYVL